MQFVSSLPNNDVFALRVAVLPVNRRMLRRIVSSVSLR